MIMYSSINDIGGGGLRTVAGVGRGNGHIRERPAGDGVGRGFGHTGERRVVGDVIGNIM
jgi:hypothetical protein